MTLTRVELAQATKSVFSCGPSTISVGCFSVAKVCTTLFCFEIDDGHFRLVPQADEEPFAGGIDQAAIRIAVLGQRNGDALFGRGQGNDADAMSPGASHVKRGAARMHRQTGGNEFGIRDLYIIRLAEIAVLDREGMDDVEFTAAGKKRFAVRRESQAVKGLFQDHAAANLFLFAEIDHDDFVRAIAGVQNRQPFAARMDRHVDRKIAQLDLPAGRLDRP